MLEVALLSFDAGPDLPPDSFSRNRDSHRTALPRLITHVDASDQVGALIRILDENWPSGKTVRRVTAVEKNIVVARAPDELAAFIGRHPVRRTPGKAGGHQVRAGNRPDLPFDGQRTRRRPRISGNLQQRPVARERLKGLHWIVGWRNKVREDPKMALVALIFITEDEVKRFRRQKSSRALEKQTMRGS